MGRPIIKIDALPEDMRKDFEDYNLNNIIEPLKQKLEKYSNLFLRGTDRYTDFEDQIIKVEPVFRVSRCGNDQEVKGLFVYVFDIDEELGDPYLQYYANIQKRETQEIGAIGINLINAALG